MTEASKGVGTDWKRAKESLSHVYWIGGATTAGKSTIAAKLANDFGMIHYSGDSMLSEHIAHATKKDYPALFALRTEQLLPFMRRVLLQTPDEIWETVRSGFREFFIMAVEDLLAMSDDRAIVAEVYFGETLGELHQLFDYNKAVFLVPTRAFHRAEYQSRFRRGWEPVAIQALENAPDPETVFMSGWAQYQLNYAQYVREECKKHNLKLLITGGHSSLEESYEAVKEYFNLSRQSK